MKYQSFTCSKCNSQQSYNKQANYLFKCTVCGRDYQVQNNDLITRADLHVDSGTNWRTNEKGPQNSISKNNSTSIVIAIYGLVIVGALIAFVAYFGRHQDSQAASQPQSTASPQPSTYYPTNADSTIVTNSEANQNGKATGPATISHTPTLINVDSLKVDSNFNPQLNYTVTNSYNKSISNIEVVVFSALDFDEQIHKNTMTANINVGNLKPNTQKSFALSIDGNIETSKGVIIKAKKVRFTDGTLLTY